MSCKPTCPKFLRERYGITTRQWKSRKRKELREIQKALSAYRIGSAYCPSANNAVVEIKTALDQLAYALSVKQWGR